MVVAGSEGGQVPETVEGNGVLWGRVADSTSVTGDLALGDVVRSLSTDEETVTAEDGVSGESGTLNDAI